MRELLPLLVLLAGLCAAAPESRRTPQRLAGGEIHRRTLAGLVWLHAADHGKGTGWIVDRRRRLLVTCYHVVGDNDTCEAVFPWRDKDRLVSERRLYLEHLPELRKLGLAVRGRVLKSNRATDLALVQLEQLPDGVCELPLAPEPARPGDRVFVAGNRFDLGVLWSAGAGSVRAVRTLKEGYFNSGRQLARGARVLMASVPINEADSGGPLVNEQGQVVGVSAAVAWETHGAGLFIDLSEVRALLATDAKPALPAEDQSIGRTVYRRSMVGVALVQYKGGSRFAGVLIDRGRRLLLTTAEAVAKEETVDVAFPVTQPSGIVVEAGYYRSQGDLLRRKGAISTGVVLAIDQRRNLALLEMGALPPGVAEPPLAKRPATTGDRVHLISHPQRLEVLWVYSFAVVRQMDRVNLGQTSDGPDPAVLIVQAPLSDGEGGGPVLDDKGELVALVSGRIGPQQQIAYTLDVSEVRDFLDEVRPKAIPKTPADHLGRGELFVRARQYDRALAAYSSAIEIDNRYVAAWAGRAWVYHLLGNHDRALADAATALRFDPRSVAALCSQAAARCGRGEASKAIAACDAALKEGARSALAYALRGWAHLIEGKPDKAIADCDESIWLDSKLALPCRVRGMAFVRKKDNDRALADFNRAILLDPHDAGGFVLRGELHWLRSDVDSALADFTQALKLAPKGPAALHGRGLVRAAKGDHAGALEDLLSAARQSPEWIARALAEVGKLSESVEEATAAAMCGDVLKGIEPLLGDRAALRKRILQGLDSAESERDPGKKSKLLRALAAAVRGELTK